jgi:sec-independent protein translocase protein TatA
MATGILSPVHIALLLAVVLMLFGAKRLPELGKSLGTGLRGFKQSLEGITEDERPQPPIESVGERPRHDAAP